VLKRSASNGEGIFYSLHNHQNKNLRTDVK